MKPGCEQIDDWALAHPIRAFATYVAAVALVTVALGGVSWVLFLFGVGSGSFAIRNAGRRARRRL